jgi:hypothetical protein
MFPHPSIKIIVALTTVILMAACECSSSSSVVASFSPPVVTVVSRPHQAMANALMKARRHSFPKNFNRKRSLLLHNQKKNADENDNKNESSSSTDKTKRTTRTSKLPVIPVLGPFVNAPPLMVCTSLYEF